ncbi:MAG: tyrosine-type recombinase/integrase [Nitrosopumilaceae archaeon]|nr:tyrosine-type recombinase/integrase [Nitrosopumilaceae archaeon]NIU01872.1 tyrosine-type recombinase/integrase [Nitrosopumilaceae archaeon]NIU88276.1 tyrosine-type recombinase/integrase [Nitrosopumilaceae archaeon]NIV66568.1 tyrosine-type recombinase/integrase [Nitrosopumilaceae archaeon]NIX62473.1 tyrosine-type recombinase/integrase [Nitrosopumilaceae archaeon]
MQDELVQKMNGYLDSIYIMSHSFSTKSSYKLAIVNKHGLGFRDFLKKEHNIDELEFVEQAKEEKLDVYTTLRDFVVFLDSAGYKPKTITTRLAAIKGYLRYLGLKIYTEDCKQIIRVPKNVKEPEAALTRELIQRVLRNASPKIQTVILMLVSSGMRIGELVQIKLSDIDFTTTPTTVRLPARITKTRSARETFISAEATNSLKDYLVRAHSWSDNGDNSHLDDLTIFGMGYLGEKRRKEHPLYPPHLIATGVLMRQLKNYLAKLPELDKKNPNGNRIIHFHAFRKFFRTVVGNVCGRDFAEALIGHSFYMDTYYQLSYEKKRDLYLEAEPHLTMSNFEEVEKNVKELSAKNAHLEQKFNDLLQYLKENSISVPNFE